MTLEMVIGMENRIGNQNVPDLVSMKRLKRVIIYDSNFRSGVHFESRIIFSVTGCASDTRLGVVFSIICKAEAYRNA